MKSVFYSVCPYGTGDIKVAANISVSSGLATLTAEQTGNIGVGCAIVYNSLTRYIAPNRIAYTSGGTTELQPGDKVQGASSGATGIVRALDLDSGTWAGGNAAGYIYFESTTGTFNSSEDLNRIRPSTSNNICTTNGSLQGNIGNGNTQFVLKTPVGADAADQSSVAVTSIGHVYASLSAYEAGFTDSSHVNNTSLVTADVVAHACCYYDHGDYTADTSPVTVDFGTTGASNYLQIYTPVGGSESKNSQRHNGVWNANKYNLERSTDYYSAINEREDFVRIIGLQFKVITSSDLYVSAIILYLSIADGANIVIADNIILGNLSGSAAHVWGIRCDWIASGTRSIKISNNIIYNFKNGSTTTCYGTLIDSGFTCYYYNNTIHNCYYGIYRQSGTVTAKNTISYNNTTDFTGSFTSSDYNFSKDTTAPGANSIHGDSDGKTPDFVNTGAGTEDFHLQSTSDAIDAGTDLSSDSNLAIWRDIDGDDRYGLTWDLGADEYVSVDTGKFRSILRPIISELTKTLLLEV